MVKNLIYIVFSLFFILKVEIAFSQNKIEKLNEKTKKLVEKTLNKENIPGISISISINDSLIFSEGFGYSNIENKTKINPSKTKFRIASITKTLTATTIARLSELNQIDLDKSVYFYLDSLPKKDFDFTIKQVGGHLSGIQRVPSTEKYSCDNNYCEKDFYKIWL
jgi:serine beta-lactamase-like protein LACTB